MKTIITTLLLGFISFVNAQVIIGDAVGTATNKTAVLLEFAAGQNKGIILPYVRTLPSTVLAADAEKVKGTILVDASTATNARMKYFNGTTWVDLSGQGANFTNTAVLANFATEQPTTATESTTAKAIIGATSSSADGVLVLESTTKAMVLPIVDNVQNIPRPAPGMMVYVRGVSPTFNKRLAVYNGSKWSYWKP